MIGFADDAGGGDRVAAARPSAGAGPGAARATTNSEAWYSH